MTTSTRQDTQERTARCGYGWTCEEEATDAGNCAEHAEVVAVRRAIFRSGQSVPALASLEELRAMLPTIAGGGPELDTRAGEEAIEAANAEQRDGSGPCWCGEYACDCAEREAAAATEREAVQAAAVAHCAHCGHCAYSPGAGVFGWSHVCPAGRAFVALFSELARLDTHEEAKADKAANNRPAFDVCAVCEGYGSTEGAEYRGDYRDTEPVCASCIETAPEAQR